jgi:predicted DCC family thiol-disulfide oxidoreductase YuxK
MKFMENPIILFDGVCNFCNSSVNFIIEHDKQGVFKFAPLQSEIGKKYIDKFGLSAIDSVILVEDEKAFTHSTAALKIAKRLDGIWSWASVFIIVPRFIRDFFYKLFAANRYRLFGKQDACMLPTPEIRARFLG